MKCPYKSVSTLPSNTGCVSGKINLCMQICSVCSGECVCWMDGLFHASVINCVDVNLM